MSRESKMDTTDSSAKAQLALLDAPSCSSAETGKTASNLPDAGIATPVDVPAERKIKLILWAGKGLFLILREGANKPTYVDRSKIDESLIAPFLSHIVMLDKFIRHFDFHRMTTTQFTENEDVFFSVIEQRFNKFKVEHGQSIDLKKETKRFNSFFHYMRQFSRLKTNDERLWRLYYGFSYYTYLTKKSDIADKYSYSFDDYAIMLKFTQTSSRHVYKHE